MTVSNSKLKDSTLDFPNLHFVKHLVKVKSSFVPTIFAVYDEVKDLLDNRISVIFPNYTLHNTKHSFRIIQHMYKLVDDPKKLNELEITMLICAALLHDIGMAVSTEDIDSIKSDEFPFSDIKYSTMKRLKNGDDIVALQEYVRRIHASLSARFITDKLSSKLVIPQLSNLDYTNELALICKSHTEEYDWIKENLKTYEVRGDYYFNSQFIASLLRLGDILDIDGQRTPYKLYQMIGPIGLSNEEWIQNLTIANNEKITINAVTNVKKVVFHGKCKKAGIHRKLLTYIDWVGQELKHSTDALNVMQSQYHLNFVTIPEVHIQTEGYTFSDYKMTLQFEAISSLLMGERIYGNRTLGLREIIQNSIDACRIRQEQERENYVYGHDIYIPKIKVTLDDKNNTVTIKDNGSGMTLDVIKKHFLNIGVSYYKSDSFVLKDLKYQPIGNYGIGFLSCFMLSDTVKVKTRHFRGRETYTIELEKSIEWTSLTKSEDINFFGTEVVLSFEQFMDVFQKNFDQIRIFMNKYFLTDGLELEIISMPPLERTVKIENLISIYPELGKGTYLINLGTKIRSFDGFAVVKRKHNFISSFEDLQIPGTLYFFDGNRLVELKEDSPVKLDDYIADKTLQYLYLPIVSKGLEDEYLNGLKFTDDVEEVIRKLEKKLIWVSILVRKEFQNGISDASFEEGDFDLIENLSFAQLVEIGHSPSCKTYYEVKDLKLFEGKPNRLYLPFTHGSKSLFDFYDSNQNQNLYIRNVLIKDFEFNFPVIASIFDIETLKININSRDFIPDISRNNLDSTTQELVNYILGKQLHKAVKKAFELDEEESNTLDNFIAQYYHDSMDLEVTDYD